MAQTMVTLILQRHGDSGNPIYSILDVLRNYITLLITKQRLLNHKAEVLNKIMLFSILYFKCMLFYEFLSHILFSAKCHETFFL